LVWFPGWFIRFLSFDHRHNNKQIADSLSCLENASQLMPGIHCVWRRVSTVDLHVLISSINTVTILFLFYKTSYLIEEANCIEPSPLVWFPGWFIGFLSFNHRHNNKQIAESLSCLENASQLMQGILGEGRRVSTVDFLVQISSVDTVTKLFFFYKTSYLNMEVNCIEAFGLVSWLIH
jgi:hypothetical protein